MSIQQTKSLQTLIILILCGALLPACTPSSISEVSASAQNSPTQATLVSVSATPFQPVPATATFTPQAPTLTPTLAAATALPEPSPTLAPPEITLLFTGVIVPGRCVQAAVDERGSADFLYDDVRDVIQSADLAVGTLNATLSDISLRMGCRFTYVLTGSPNNADALQRAGFDIMSVATNHIKNCGFGDCGDKAFFETLDNLRRVNILPVGAGLNHTEAMQPVVVTVQGVRFGIVSLGMVESMVFASEDTPGIAVLTDDNLRQAIAAAREVADVVIAMPHWGPEDSPIPNEWQIHYAQVAVEAGADVVVGNHTHVAQAFQTINGIDVFYGLGNFVFDQDWDLDHQQGLILQLTFSGSRYAGYELIPTHVDGDGTVHLADAEEAAQILERVTQASLKIK